MIGVEKRLEQDEVCEDGEREHDARIKTERGNMGEKLGISKEGGLSTGGKEKRTNCRRKNLSGRW